ncbi:MAG: PD-(D/E)XK nuclease family protein [Elusimicrobiota bacterium]|jgi:ATP-dependent helicase/nuclease subunit B
MLTLTTGSFRSIEKALLKDLGERRTTDPLTSLLVLSPSGHMLTRLQSEFAKQHPACLNIHFLSFYGLADRLLSETEPTDQLVADPALYAELIRELLEGNRNVEFVLRRHLHPQNRPLSRGLPAALASTLRDLRDSGARVVDALHAALEGHLGETAQDAAPALELYARVYDVLHSRGLRTHADQLRRATQQLSTNTWIRNQKSVFLYGFYDLTGVQLDFILAFSQHPDARLYAPCIAGDPAYAFAERLLKDPALTGKIGQTLSTAGGKESVNPATEIWNCSGLYDEVWLAAKKILRLAGEGIPYSHMLLSARALGPYLSTLRDIFQVHQIPYAMEQEEPAGAYPLIKTARQLLLLAQNDFPIGSTFDLLKSAYFSASQDSQWELIARQAGIVSGWDSWEERLRHWSAEDAPEELLESLAPAEARRQARLLLKQLSELRQDLTAEQDGRHPWSHHVRWAEQLFRRWLRLPPDATHEEKHLWEGLLGALRALATLDALDHPVSRARFLEVWEDKLDKLTVQLAPSNNFGVQVLDVMAARGLSFEAVFLLGLNEKSFPRLIREDPFLSDNARSALAGTLGCRLNRKLDGYQEERLLFALAKEMAEKHFHLSYQRSDEEGKALVPSLYLHEMIGADTPRHHLARVLGEKWRQVPFSDLTPKELSVFLNRENLDPGDCYRALGYDHALYHSLRQAQEQLESFQNPLGQRDGLVGHEPITRKIADRGFSPDSLTDLAECPYRYYAGKVLKLRAREDTASRGDLAADASGKLIHHILETFYKRHSPQSLAGNPSGRKTMMDPPHRPPVESISRCGPVYENIDRRAGPPESAEDDVLFLKQLDLACKETFTLFQDTAADLYPIAWAASQQKIRLRLRQFINKDLEELSESRFKPTYFEERIEGEMAELTPPVASTRFRGRVDRIDLREDQGIIAYRVVDYKTGRPSRRGAKTETQILRGNYLQLPVYLSLVGPWLKQKLGKPVRPVGAAFYNLADWEKGQPSPQITPEFWTSCRKAFSENLAGLLALVEKGIFYIRPSDDQGYCDWCEFSQICRKDHKPSASRSLSSPIRRANDQRLSRKAE